MSVNYLLYLDTPDAPDALREWLVSEHGFTVSQDWHSRDGTPWLVSNRGVVLVDSPDPGTSGPFEYRQPRTLEVVLDPNKEPAAYSFLFRLAGDILQHCRGDAVLGHDTGETILLRRGEVVWVDPDPYTREHLFSGSFRPVNLIVGLPSPVARESAHQVGAMR